MHFTLLALPTLFLSTLAAPTTILDGASLSSTDEIVSELESAVPSSSLDTADLTSVESSVPSLPANSESLDTSDLTDVSTLETELESAVPTKRQLDDLDLSSAEDLVDEVESKASSLESSTSSLDTSSLDTSALDTSSLPIKRQAEPVIDLLNTLLATISPIAGEILDEIRSFTNSQEIRTSDDALIALEGLLNELVIEIENAAGNFTTSSTVTGGNDKEIADAMKEILNVIDAVIEEVKEYADVAAIDALISELNGALNDLIKEGGDVVDGLLEELNEVLGDEALKGLEVPALKSGLL